MSGEECTPSSDIRHGQDVDLHSAADPAVGDNMFGSADTRNGGLMLTGS